MCDFLSKRSRKRGKRCSARLSLNSIKSDSARNPVYQAWFRFCFYPLLKNGRCQFQCLGESPARLLARWGILLFYAIDKEVKESSFCRTKMSALAVLDSRIDYKVALTVY